MRPSCGSITPGSSCGTAATQAGLNVYIPTLSARLVGYKGLLTSLQFADFYPDLADPAFETGLALFHRRYSTNTYPNWTLAQPFRLLCHNGEINTIRTTRNAVHAYARGLEPPLPGRDLLTPRRQRLGQPRRMGRAPRSCERTGACCGRCG